MAVQFEDVVNGNTLKLKDAIKVAAPKGMPGITLAADQIWVWKSDIDDWAKYFYSSKVKGWCSSTDTTKETEDTITTGQTVFFRRGGGGVATTISLSGGVTPFAAKPSYPNLVAGKYAFMAYPWPVNMPIADFSKYQGAPKGMPGSTLAADQIWVWKSDIDDWVKYFYSSKVKAWCISTDTSKATTDFIPAGEGFFFRRGGGGSTDTVTFTYDN